MRPETLRPETLLQNNFSYYIVTVQPSWMPYCNITVTVRA